MHQSMILIIKGSGIKGPPELPNRCCPKQGTTAKRRNLQLQAQQGPISTQAVTKQRSFSYAT